MRFRSCLRIACAGAAAILAACDTGTAPNDHDVASIALAVDGGALSLAEVRELAPVYRSAAGTLAQPGPDLSWRSSDPSIITVDRDGHARGVALGGPVTITVTTRGRSASARVRVIPDRIVLSPDVSSLVVGRTLTLTGVAVDFLGAPIAAVSAPIMWATSDPAIATVDAITGLVTARTPGEVFISARVAGRTSGVHIETGELSPYDGAWLGMSPCSDCVYPTAYPIAFDVLFGRVKSFRMTITGPPPFPQCGAGGEPALTTPPVGAPNAIVTDSRFEFRLTADVATVSGMFTSPTTATGMHTAMTIPVVCRSNILPVPPLTIAAASFSATKQ